MKRPEVAAVLSVYNRPPLVLRQTLTALVHSIRELDRLALVVLDDGSDDTHRQRYAPMRRELESRIRVEWIETSTLALRPRTYHIGGHNNPALVTNLAIEAAIQMRPHRILLLSSDVMLVGDALPMALAHPSDRIVVGRTFDFPSQTLFCSSERIWPMCWFVLADATAIWKTPFDETYLDGMAFEDNDFMGRLLLQTGRMAIDDRIVCLHQSHAQTAYSDGWVCFQRSEEYTRSKWGGIPFRTRDTSLAFRIERTAWGAELCEPAAPHLIRP